MQKVTGIGGVFLKAKDASTLATWYDKHPGFTFGENLYVNFKWLNENNPAIPGNTVFSFFKSESNYFEPSVGPFMINFRIKDLKTLLEELREEGVNIVGETVEEEYGKFGWIVDPEGNKIELGNLMMINYK